MTLAVPSAVLDSTKAKANDNPAVIRVADAVVEDLSRQEPANDVPVAMDSQPGSSNDSDAQQKPPKTPKPPAEKHVVQRTRREICDAVVTTARTNDLPVPFFIRLLFQESGFKSDVVSRAGAQGIAQFMPETAATVGLHNPFDPLPAIAASARLLGDLVRQFGNLGLAAAAYNAGPRRIQDWLAKKGKLPEETQHYVKTITGKPPESWADRSRGEVLATTLPREAPCQEAASTIMANATKKHLSKHEFGKRAAGAARGPVARDRKSAHLASEQTPKIMVAEHTGRRPAKAADRSAIQLAAASKKHRHKS
ncbi:MAG TPA: lytic transglycosylase domain-containing protein [Pseudolabrys sp.]|nr:lytic transglycosylase domain-containing protein [Pseudolabrys sp.]